MKESTKYFVGVDLHKTILQVCVLDGDGEVIKERRFRGGSLEGGLMVVDWLTQWKDGGRVCVEALGMNRWFVNACQERGLEVVVVDATKMCLRMLGKKTDRRDAYELALILPRKSGHPDRSQTAPGG
jgi:transposase